MRIRSIKPEFWRSDDIDTLSWPTRLIFIGLWSYVDDNGVGIDKLSNITAELFAHDLSIEPIETLSRVESALATLSSARLITRYTAESKAYLYITNWERHQRVNNPNKPRFPLPTSENAAPTETLNRPDVDPQQGLATGAGEQGSSGTGEPGNKDLAVAPPIDPKPARYPEAFEEFWGCYPRTTGKIAAGKAWAKAIKSASASEIVEGALRYANDPNLPDEEQYIPHPSRWLNEGRWDDGPLPSRSGVQDRSGPTRQDSKVLDMQERGQRLAAAVRNNNVQQLEIS